LPVIGLTPDGDGTCVDGYIYNPGNATFDLESPCMRPETFEPAPISIFRL
jgi:hypothetical protein